MGIGPEQVILFFLQTPQLCFDEIDSGGKLINAVRTQKLVRIDKDAVLILRAGLQSYFRVFMVNS